MLKTTFRLTVLLCICLTTSFVQPLLAQQLSLNSGLSRLAVYGTSGAHDWNVKADDLGGTLDFSQTDSILELNQLSFNVKTESIKGDKNSMLKKIREALQVATYKTISYQLKSAKTFYLNPNHFKAETLGTLTINGVSKPISLTFLINRTQNNFQISGETHLNMTDYQVEPPRALFGLLKVDDMVNIKFLVNYQ